MLSINNVLQKGGNFMIEVINSLTGNFREAMGNVSKIADRMSALQGKVSNATGELKKFGAATTELDAIAETTGEIVNAFGEVSGAASEMKALTSSVNDTTDSLREFGEATTVLEKYAAGMEVIRNVKNTAEQAVRAYNTTKNALLTLKAAYKSVIGKVNTLIAKQAAEKAMTTTAVAKDTTVRAKNKAVTTKSTAAKIRDTIATKAGTIAEKAKTLAMAAQNKVMAKKAALTKKLTAANIKSTAISLAKGVAMTVKAIAIAAASVAKAIFNAVVKANPIGAFIVIVLAAVAAVRALINIFRRSREATTKNGENISALAERYNRSTEEISADMERLGTDCLDVWESKQEAVDRFADEFGRCADEIREEILELADQYGCLDEALSVWEEQENGIRNLAEEFGMSADDIRADMERMGTTCQKVWRRQESGIRDLADRWGKCANDIRSEVDALAERYGDHEKALQVWADQRQLLDDVANKWNVSTDSILADLDEMGYSFECQAEAIQFWESKQYESLQGVADEWGMCVDDIKAEMERYGISLDEWTENQQRAWEDTQASIRQHTGNIINNFRELPSALEQCAGEMADILYRNRQIYNEWQQNLSRASATLNADVVRELESMGTASNQIMNDLFDFDPETATEAQREAHYNAKRLVAEIEAGIQDAEAHARGTAFASGEEVGEAYLGGYEYAFDGNEDTTLIVEVVEEATEAAIPVAQEAGESVGEAYIEGVKSGLEKVDFSVVTENASSALRKMEERSSSAMDAVKEIFTDGMSRVNDIMNTALIRMTNSANARMVTLNWRISEGLTRVVNQFNTLRDRLRTTGFNAMQGFHEGLVVMEGSVLRTARQIANNVAKTMQRALDINSPSRVMKRLGRGTMGGFADGMENMQRRVQSVVSRTAGMIQAGLDDVLDANKITSQLQLAIAPPDNIHQNRLMERLIDAVEAGKNIIMDSGELVGATYPHIDNAAGHAIVYNNRWGR
jgi:hypothetical protein